MLINFSFNQNFTLLVILTKSAFNCLILAEVQEFKPFDLNF
jgi:hypothetical protein